MKIRGDNYPDTGGLRDEQSEMDEDRADKLLTQSDSLRSQATSLLESAQAG